MEFAGLKAIVTGGASGIGAAAAAMLKEREAYQGGGQELRTVWAREDAGGVKLHLRGAKGLTYS
ncbi:MAG: hypothetical protein ACK4K6_15235, partial [Pseudarthrobacter sp.]